MSHDTYGKRAIVFIFEQNQMGSSLLAENQEYPGGELSQEGLLEKSC